MASKKTPLIGSHESSNESCNRNLPNRNDRSQIIGPASEMNDAVAALFRREAFNRERTDDAQRA